MVDDKRLTVEYWPVNRILPYAANARMHSDAQVAQLAESMRAYGFTQPCLVDADGVLIAGHGRLLAAAKLEMTEAPVIRLGHLTEAQARAYRLADNRIALNSTWDEGLLAQELEALSADFDLEALGFDADELAELLPPSADAVAENEEREEATPEPPAIAAAQAGDVWILGDHRVVCGDSTDKAAVGACLGQETPHLMVTDPPYGVEYDPSWRHGLDKAKNRRTGAVLNDGVADWQESWTLFPGDVAYVWHDATRASVVDHSLRAVGFDMRGQIIWVKQKMVLGRGDYHWQHEPCWYAVRHNRGGALPRRPQANDCVEYRQSQSCIQPRAGKLPHQSLHAKAGGVHA